MINTLTFPRSIRTSKFAVSDMAVQVKEMTPEMKLLMEAREKCRGSLKVPTETYNAIQEVRLKLPSGADGDGFIPAGKRHDGGKSYARGGGGGGGKQYYSGGGNGKPFNNYNNNTGSSRFGAFRSGGGQQQQQVNYTKTGNAWQTKAPASVMAPVQQAQNIQTVFKPKFMEGLQKPVTAPIVKEEAAAPVAATPYIPRQIKSFAQNLSAKEMILQKQIQGYLNKFCEERYEVTKKQFINFMEDDKTKDPADTLLPDFMKLLFNKAVMDKFQCANYARLLFELCDTFPYLRTEMDKLYTNFFKIFNNISDISASSDDLDAMDKENRDNDYRAGYCKFISELVKYGVVTEDYFLQMIQTIINNMKTVSALEGKQNLMKNYAICMETIIAVLKNNKPEIIKSLRTSVMTTMKDDIMSFTVTSADRPSLDVVARMKILNAMSEL